MALGVGGFGDAADHAAKDGGVDGPGGVPVEQSGQADRLEYRRLAQQRTRSVVVRRCFKFQPGPAGEFHLGLESHQTAGFVELHPPPVHGVADGQAVGMRAAPTDAHAADQQVDETAHAP